VAGVTAAEQRTGVFLCLASAAAFGALAIFGKLAYGAGVGIVTLLFVRFALAAPALWLGVVAQRRPRAVGGAAAAATALGLGAIGYATQAGLFFAALQRMDASLLSLLLYTYPAFVTLAAIGLGRETASRRRLGALLVASGGVALVLVGAGGSGFDWLGAAMGLGAALAYTAYILVSDRVGRRQDPLALSALIATGAALTFGVAGAASGALDFGFEAEGWLWLGLLAAISTVGAVTLFFAGLRRVGPSNAAILSTLEPPVTTLLAFLAFGEALTALQLAGGALVLAAVVVLAPRPGAVEPAG
jgi:drug/metabolite transporter (DMT)-like permease